MSCSHMEFIFDFELSVMSFLVLGAGIEPSTRSTAEYSPTPHSTLIISAVASFLHSTVNTGLSVSGCQSLAFG